jgi:hypothetical protein
MDPQIATRMPGDKDCSLAFTGRYFRVAVIFVGIKDRLLDEGLKPYRKRAKRLIYRDRFDAIYLMARDRNMGAVEERGVEPRRRWAHRKRFDLSLSTSIRLQVAIWP